MRDREKKIKCQKKIWHLPLQVSDVTYETRVLVAAEKQLFCWRRECAGCRAPALPPLSSGAGARLTLPQRPSPLTALGPEHGPGYLWPLLLSGSILRDSPWPRKSTLKVSQGEEGSKGQQEKGGCWAQGFPGHLLWFRGLWTIPCLDLSRGIHNHSPGNPSSIWAEPLASPKPAERSRRGLFRQLPGIDLTEQATGVTL